MAFVLIVNTVRTRSDWTAMVVLFVLAAALVALYGVYQNFFMTSTTQSWVDEKMFTDIKTRVYSTLDNPNVLGEYLIMLMPVVPKGRFRPVKKPLSSEADLPVSPAPERLPPKAYR